MPDETRAVRMADLPEIYQAPVEGGQGESSGPSIFPSSILRQEVLDRMAEDLRRRARGSEIAMWRDGIGRYTRWAEGSSLNYYPGPNFTSESITQQTRERGEQMRFSGKPDPITTSEMESLERFYRKVLLDGYGSWPLSAFRLLIFIDGKGRAIYNDSRWSCQEDYLYIGSSRDEGVGELSSPAARLAIIATLMGITGHSGNQELIGLLSERLAKVMAGVYESVVSPLAETLDSRPIRRMAWSTSGGLASWVDGEWVGLTGEPVAVGAGWTVIDSEEGPIEEGLPEVTSQVLPVEPEEIPIPF